MWSSKIWRDEIVLSWFLTILQSAVGRWCLPLLKYTFVMSIVPPLLLPLSKSTSYSLTINKSTIRINLTSFYQPKRLDQSPTPPTTIYRIANVCLIKINLGGNSSNRTKINQILSKNRLTQKMNWKKNNRKCHNIKSQYLINPIYQLPINSPLSNQSQGRLRISI